MIAQYLDLTTQIKNGASQLTLDVSGYDYAIVQIIGADGRLINFKSTISESALLRSPSNTVPNCFCIKFTNISTTSKVAYYNNCNGIYTTLNLAAGATESVCGDSPGGPAKVNWEIGFPCTENPKNVFNCPSNCCTLPDVTIGTQTWTACNLNVTTYRNGDPIPQVTDYTQWASLTTGAWCYYNNDPANECIYGKLYNYAAVKDPRGLAPVGYRIPSYYEYYSMWNVIAPLNQVVASNLIAGRLLKEAGTAHWFNPNDATNATGFTALPGGYRAICPSCINTSGFFWLQSEGLFWTSTIQLANKQAAFPLTPISSCVPVNFDSAWVARMRAAYPPNQINGCSGGCNSGVGNITNCYGVSLDDGNSVRLIKDCPSLPDVTIGSQIWKGSSLTVDRYANGDLIPEIQDPTAWSRATTGAWCYYNNDPQTECVYGRLYNWYAVNDPRGLAPTGYHIPTLAEWTTLMNVCGPVVTNPTNPTTYSTAAGLLKEAGTAHWNSPNLNNGVPATDSLGFTALGGGRRVNTGVFDQLKAYGHFWTSTEVSNSNAYQIDMNNADKNGNINSQPKKSGMNVRCLKN
jgi:hypothetical protein